MRDLPERVATRTEYDALVSTRKTEIDSAAPADAVALASRAGVTVPANSPLGLSVLTARVIARRDQVRDKLHADLTSKTVDEKSKLPLELLERPGARFFRPADPVAVVYGCKRSVNHGSDGMWRSDGTLYCRFSGQTVRALDTAKTTLAAGRARGQTASLQAANIRSHFDIDAATGIVSKAAGLGTPDPVWDLAAEWILLDPGWAREMIRLALSHDDADAVATVNLAQRLIWTEQMDAAITPTALMTTAGFTGSRPSPLGVEQWAQPWSPLFLCWRVTWYPTRYPIDIVPPTAQKSLPEWKFDGQDYEWTGIGTLDHERAVTLQGKSILSSTSTQALQDNLKSLFEANLGKLDSATRQRIEQLRSVLASADLMAQPLTGFHDQLLQFDRNQYYTPTPS